MSALIGRSQSALTLTPDALARLALRWVERGALPDPLIRAGIRQLCRGRLAELAQFDGEMEAERLAAFVAAMEEVPVALLPERANDQHYELPASFYQEVLGRWRKYSCSLWRDGVHELHEAEEAALAVSCDHAEIAEGQRILELGCGWGSLSLWIASHYPTTAVTAVSNSHSQREFIVAEAARRGVENLQVITADMNHFDTDQRFDRVVSLEMFEHMRNWGELMRRISGWLDPGGRFLMHIFCHRGAPYLFADRGDDDWMNRYFFSGGMMPSDDLPLRFQRDLRLLRQWRWSGRHYARTANAWLANLDAAKGRVMPILAECYGEAQAALWFMRWRLFFIACAENFGLDGGEPWRVGHYLFARREER